MHIDHNKYNINIFFLFLIDSGYGDLASWYLKHIIVKDLLTKETFYFICEKWLAVEKADGKISRIIPIATQVQKNKLSYAIRKQTEEKLLDTHLWLSILTRPVKSSFTRLDRTVCCFFLLYISMLANILYYDIDKTINNGGLVLGPFLLTPTQIGVGIMSNLIVFPPTFLLMQLFRKSKRKTNELKKIKKKTKNEFDEIKDQQSKDVRQKNKKNEETDKMSFALPWWFKIIAYILSFILIVFSIFFIIIQGIKFGDEKVQKWLTSFVVSILSSIFLTQPIKVSFLLNFILKFFKIILNYKKKIVLTVVFLTIICRKIDDKQDMELWKDDNEDDLNNAKINLSKSAFKDENQSENIYVNKNCNLLYVKHA